jgi:hypothetical protein
MVATPLASPDGFSVGRSAAFCEGWRGVPAIGWHFITTYRRRYQTTLTRRQPLARFPPFPMPQSRKVSNVRG